jgi:beta-glucosidase
MTDITPTFDGSTEIDTRFRDNSLPIAQRVEILLDQMTIEEKAGLFFHTMIAVDEDGSLPADNPFGLPSAAATEDYVTGKLLSHFNILGAAPTGERMAMWHNRMQELAATTRLGIPITFSTDPRNSFSDNPAAAMMAGPFSQWPEPIGLAAIADEALVEQFGDIVRQEYLAVGIRVALHPQLDLTTEPRWSRQLQTFGEDAELTSRLGAAYIRGFQGAFFGKDSVSTMVKHFPGGGPQKDGEDPHFEFGREQVYPGNNFEYHLRPFEVAFEAGARQVMPYYGMPVGTEFEEVAFGFNKSVVTGLLRERYGFDGIVCTDWGLINDAQLMGGTFPARAWGAESLTPRERMIKILNAGVDQFGGESGTEMLIDIIRSGDVEESRIDVSVRRLLREKFALGLFDNPYVDHEGAGRVVGSPEFRAKGEAAQRKSVTLITNGRNGKRLPLSRGARVYVEGIEADLAGSYGTVVESAADADVAIIRLPAPFEPRAGIVESFFHSGSLDFPAEVVEHVREIAERTPVVIEVALERPAILTPLADVATAIVATFGISPTALLDVLFGVASPQGSLPFDLPSSMDAVRASKPDVPFDTVNPLFRHGHGLRY